MEQNQSVIIVAGGKGERMKSDLPKQFLLLQDRPVLMHTLEIFHRFNTNIQIILVLPASQQQYWEELCINHHFTISHLRTNGGHTRFESVSNGLKLVTVGNIVAIHDGVRPLASKQTLENCFHKAIQTGAAIPVIDVYESVREITDNSSKAVDRNNYKLVQTPQVFSYDIITKAYQQNFSELFTDDASVVEAAGYSVDLVEGNRENIKITTPIDLQIASLFL